MGPKVKTNAGGQHAQSKSVTAGITPTSDVSMTSSLTSIASSIGSQPASQPAPTIAAPPTYYIQHTPTSIHAAKLDTWSFEKIAYVIHHETGPQSTPRCHEDQQLLEDITNTKEAWDTLHECHKKVGPITQILLIQEAQVTSLLSSSSKDHLFTSSNIRARLNTEQQLLDNEKACSADIVLAASARPKHGNYSHGGEKTCSLCVKRGHTIEGCWQPRGEMAGQHDEVLTKIHVDKLAKQGKTNKYSRTMTSL
ncbi:hypothetical protein BDN67DRAFT_984704 [Paxillus ammoniavirescens]|nr:hypothetical protein BDN67DRAFT_984704 [Paxillus ammoniavirescens]